MFILAVLEERLKNYIKERKYLIKSLKKLLRETLGELLGETLAELLGETLAELLKKTLAKKLKVIFDGEKEGALSTINILIF